jgi:hypothetical protein
MRKRKRAKWRKRGLRVGSTRRTAKSASSAMNRAGAAIFALSMIVIPDEQLCAQGTYLNPCMIGWNCGCGGCGQSDLSSRAGAQRRTITSEQAPDPEALWLLIATSIVRYRNAHRCIDEIKLYGALSCKKIDYKYRREPANCVSGWGSCRCSYTISS